MGRAFLALPKSFFPQLRRANRLSIRTGWMLVEPIGEKLDLCRTLQPQLMVTARKLPSGERIGNVAKTVAKMMRTGLWQKAEDGNFADIDFAVGNGGHGELDGIAGFVAAGGSLGAVPELTGQIRRIISV